LISREKKKGRKGGDAVIQHVTHVGYKSGGVVPFWRLNDEERLQAKEDIGPLSQTKRRKKILTMVAAAACIGPGRPGSYRKRSQAHQDVKKIKKLTTMGGGSKGEETASHWSLDQTGGKRCRKSRHTLPRRG